MIIYHCDERIGMRRLCCCTCCTGDRHINNMPNPIIKVHEGKLLGAKCKTVNDVVYYSFKKIPYAKPPENELRFSIPHPPEPWDGVRDATEDCPPSHQYEQHSGNCIGQEDCLYLNVYTPKLPSLGSPLLPVMFYIHGGGFISGHGTDTNTNGPDYLIEKDVVMVSINYRLGIFGFLALDLKEAPGNMGLRDQVQALKWVKQNIDKFNGDPNNVTIFGLSAGGASVEYIMLSPTAKELFHKAIAQSGTSLCHWAQTSKMKQLAAKIPLLDGKSIKDDELLHYLKSLPTIELAKLSMMALAEEKFKGGIHFGFAPVIEQPKDWEPFLDQPTYDLLSRGEFTQVPFMTGFATREGLLTLALGKPILSKVMKEKKFTPNLPFQFVDSEADELERKLKKIYLAREQDLKDPEYFAIDYFSDVDIIGGVYTATSLIAKKNSCPVYFYEFAYDGNLNAVKYLLNIKREGACHGDEIGYLLRNDMLPKPPYQATDKWVLDSMVTMWTNFAKCGNPTPKIDKVIPLKWDRVTEDQMWCFVISDKMIVKKEVYRERMELYQQLYREKSRSE